MGQACCKLSELGARVQDFQGLLRRPGRRRLAFLLSCIFAPVHSGRGASQGYALPAEHFDANVHSAQTKRLSIGMLPPFSFYAHASRMGGARSLARSGRACGTGVQVGVAPHCAQQYL